MLYSKLVTCTLYGKGIVPFCLWLPGSPHPVAGISKFIVGKILGNSTGVRVLIYEAPFLLL